jgi:hypothetical protein
MKQARELAQELFNKALVPVMDLPLTDDIIKSKGLEIALIMLDQIFDRNTDQSKNDLYCETQIALLREEVEY